jgi:hypothetical protein
MLESIIIGDDCVSLASDGTTTDVPEVFARAGSYFIDSKISFAVCDVNLLAKYSKPSSPDGQDTCSTTTSTASTWISRF